MDDAMRASNVRVATARDLNETSTLLVDLLPLWAVVWAKTSLTFDHPCICPHAWSIINTQTDVLPFQRNWVYASSRSNAPSIKQATNLYVTELLFTDETPGIVIDGGESVAVMMVIQCHVLVCGYR